MLQLTSEAPGRVQEEAGQLLGSVGTSKLPTRDQVRVLLKKTRPLPNLVSVQPINCVLSASDGRKKFRLDSLPIHHSRGSESGAAYILSKGEKLCNNFGKNKHLKTVKLFISQFAPVDTITCE